MSKLVYEIYLFCIGLDSGSAGTATGRKPGATHPAGMIREELPSGGSTQTSVGEDRGLAVARNTRSATHLKRLPQGRLSTSPHLTYTWWRLRVCLAAVSSNV